MTIVNRRPVDINYRTITSPQTPQTALVGVTTSQVVPYNAARAGLIIVNLSTVNVYFALGVAAQAQSGLTLLPNMGWKMDEFTFTVEAINAIADQAGSAISIQEFNI